MSKRIDKKRMKRQAEITSAPRDIKAPVAKEAENIDFYIQYQGQEYLEREIIERIQGKCKVEGALTSGNEKLSVYLKPEEQKAYYTCGSLSGDIDI
mgnify:FL=1